MSDANWASWSCSEAVRGAIRWSVGSTVSLPCSLVTHMPCRVGGGCKWSVRPSRVESTSALRVTACAVVTAGHEQPARTRSQTHTLGQSPVHPNPPRKRTSSSSSEQLPNLADDLYARLNDTSDHVHPDHLKPDLQAWHQLRIRAFGVGNFTTALPGPDAVATLTLSVQGPFGQKDYPS